MPQQTGLLSAGNKMVSHVPVSIETKTRSSSSSLSSSASKLGPEKEYITSAHWNDKLLKKSSVVSTDDSVVRSCSSISTKSHSSEFMRRPTKKARTTSTDPEIPSCVTTPRLISPISAQHESSLLLLAEEGDEFHLNPLHVFVRKQIEVFAATATELAQPAPGRKQPIQLHQVGLRCIHCRNNLSKKSRVKRAVCYPSTVARIYHSVSDMKFDHFSQCRHLPPDVRQTFETLKMKGKREAKGDIRDKKVQSSASTALYYRESAARMGLVDSPWGIIFTNNTRDQNPQHRSKKQESVTLPLELPHVSQPSQVQQAPPNTNTYLQHLRLAEYTNLLIQQQALTAANAAAVTSMLLPQVDISDILAAKKAVVDASLHLQHLTQSMNSSILQPFLTNVMRAGASAEKPMDLAIAIAKEEGERSSQRQPHNPLKRSHESSLQNSADITSHGARVDSKVPMKRITVPLSAPEDAEVLNPIHCFVRKHLEFFSADDQDIAAPCPGRKSRVTLGQVGIRCKHCAKLKVSATVRRAKRTVCYPPSLGAIYHSVSNMKFDHFGICPCLPDSAREELTALRASCSGRSQSNGNNTTGGMSTAQYYRISAAAMGLVDTDKGIRFSDPSDVAPNTSGRICVQPSEGKENKAATSPLPIPVTQTSVPKDELTNSTGRGISALMEAAARASSI